MEGTLSATEQQLIAEVCEGYRSWSSDERQPPQLVEVLSGGHSNRAVRLRGRRDYVLRIPMAEPPVDACRRREHQAHDAAARAGLAPRIRFVDEDSGVLLTDHVDECPTLDLEQVARLLRRIHALPVFGSPLLLEERLCYWDEQRPRDSKTSALLAMTGNAYRTLRKMAADLDRELLRGQAALCHNDLLAANRRMADDRTVAIDWEYARAGHVYFDLAVCSSELTDADRQALVEHYLQRTPSEHEQLHILAAEGIYAVIAASWYECHPGQAAPAAHQAARDHLATRLSTVIPDG